MRERPLVQLLAVLTAVVLLVLGILGLLAGAKLFGIVDLGLAVAGLVLARTAETARAFLVVGGVVYLALWVLGIVAGPHWIPAGPGDNWLHFGLGVGMIGLGYVGSRSAAEPSTA
jgi:hypothetical protein